MRERELALGVPFTWSFGLSCLDDRLPLRSDWFSPWSQFSEVSSPSWCHQVPCCSSSCYLFVISVLLNIIFFQNKETSIWKLKIKLSTKDCWCPYQMFPFVHLFAHLSSSLFSFSSRVSVFEWQARYICIFLVFAVDCRLVKLSGNSYTAA